MRIKLYFIIKTYSDDKVSLIVCLGRILSLIMQINLRWNIVMLSTAKVVYL